LQPGGDLFGLKGDKIFVVSRRGSLLRRSNRFGCEGRKTRPTLTCKQQIRPGTIAVVISALHPQTKSGIIQIMAKVKPITKYHLTEHAKEQMARRQIGQDDVANVLSAPEQIETVRQGRVIYQSRIKAGKPPQRYLLRVFIDIEREPAEVVTVYRTSKIKKYWRVDK